MCIQDVLRLFTSIGYLKDTGTRGWTNNVRLEISKVEAEFLQIVLQGRKYDEEYLKGVICSFGNVEI